VLFKEFPFKLLEELRGHNCVTGRERVLQRDVYSRLEEYGC